MQTSPRVLLVVREFCYLLGHSHTLTTVSPGRKDQSEGPLLVLPPRRSALIWRYWNELNHNGELLTKMTNRVKKRKCRDREESPNSPRA